MWDADETAGSPDLAPGRAASPPRGPWPRRSRRPPSPRSPWRRDRRSPRRPGARDRRRRSAPSRAAPRGGLGQERVEGLGDAPVVVQDRKSTRLNSSHMSISYAVFCLKKKKKKKSRQTNQKKNKKKTKKNNK